MTKGPKSGASHCTFCDLVRGAGEVSACYEDADAIAFMDIQPVNPGHVLVVPREHHESLFDVPRELGVHLFDVTMRVAAAVRRVTQCEGLNIVVNSGAAAGQDEFHYHVHIIPRRKGDGFDVPLPFDGSEMPDRTLLDATAARISAALRDPMRHERSPDRRGGGRAREGGGRVPPGGRIETRVSRRTRTDRGSGGANGRTGPAAGARGEGAHGEVLGET
ncbi:MAG: HIT family protein [Gemmatimonadaceae bacterium]